jgi:hypothetical protein
MGWAMTKKTILFLTSICFQGWHEVAAQSRQQSPDVFQRIGSSEDSQASLAEWRKIPGIELRCIARVLNQRGQTLESMLLKGISPSSPSLDEVRSQCKIKSGTNPSDETVVPKR